MEIVKNALEKAARVAALEVTAAELEKINRQAIVPLEAKDVFAFRVYAGDNETDDLNFMPFSTAALKDLQTLYIGCPVIKDHTAHADNQIARVYDSYLELPEGKQTQNGAAMTALILKCYMVRTAGNADLIKEIAAGIKREVSTSCWPKRLVCSVCGIDNMTDACRHWAGRAYDGKTCMMTIDGAVKATELSFVVVPAQPRAGAIKGAEENKVEKSRAAAEARIRAAKAFIFTKLKGEKNHDETNEGNP